MEIIQIGTGSYKIPPEGYGGIEQYIFNISTSLAGLGHRVTILDIKSSKDSPDRKLIYGIQRIRIHKKLFNRSADYPVIGYFLSFIDSFLFTLKASRHLQTHSYDVIHFHRLLTSPLLVYLNKKLRKRMVYTSHSSIWSKSNRNFSEKLAIKLDLWTMRHVGIVIAQAGSLKETFVKEVGITPEKITVIPSGVDTSKFRREFPRENNVKGKYGLDSRLLVLFTGQIVPRKGIEYLIKAADILVNLKNYRDLLFLLVGPEAETGFYRYGTGDYSGQLLVMIIESNLEHHVKITGSVSQEDLVGLFSACDIFVLPSLAESSPAVTVQAMASSKPVIGSNITGISSQIKDGWNGYLVEPANYSSLAEKIKYLLDNPEERLRMGQNGRKLAEGEFDWKMIGEKISGVYRAINKK